jgi:hypothetical protein
VTDRPELLTVEEAAALLRIGRTKAYAMAREWRDSNGRSGLPVVDFGHALRVPRRALEDLIDGAIRPITPSVDPVREGSGGERPTDDRVRTRPPVARVHAARISEAKAARTVAEMKSPIGRSTATATSAPLTDGPEPARPEQLDLFDLPPAS